MSKLEFAKIRHEFRGPDGAAATPVIADVDFSVDTGRFVAVVGPSGCGKSTLLQMAAGLLKPTGGDVRQDGTVVSDVNRAVGFVPQQAMLFPWKTLGENVELPLVLRGVPAAERRQRVEAVLKEVGLDGFAGHYPHQLSGGMQKRGAIARTLVYRPKAILMDEPFGALDAQTRMVMQNDLQALSAREGASVLFITHDIGEAILLADEVIVLSRRPARMIARVLIELARPRDMFEPFRNPGYEATYTQVWALFRSEITGATGAAA